MMLQSLRENLKGAVAIVVLAIFIVPLVLFGVEQLFVGSVGGTNAAKVNGESINALSLQREIVSEKYRLQQQFDLSPSDPRLDDSNLRGPALQRLVHQLALAQFAQDGQMGVSKDVLWRDIAKLEAFQEDGKFNYDYFKDRISNFYTPATFLEASAKDYVLRQLNTGITQSSFVTEADLSLIAAITQQERDFFTVHIPRDELDEIEVSDEEVAEFYQANSDRFMNPETVTIDYLLLSVDELAQSRTPAEEDVRAAYEFEVSEFEARPKYQVAHILIEEGEQSSQIIEEVEGKLQQGADFGELATEYSDDLGSKNNAGALGEMVEDAFPEAFVEAAKKLEVGSVSGPVETDSGTHFIKLLSVDDVEPPTFQERREALARQIARQSAQEDFIAGMAQLDELTFGTDNLRRAAEELDLEVKRSEPFSRAGGSDIAANSEVVDAAFADDVLNQNQNSRVLELAGEKAVVLRLADHTPQALKPLAEVADGIKEQLLQERKQAALQAKAKSLEDRLKSTDSPQQVAQELGYEFTAHDNIQRDNTELERAVVNKAFELPRPQTATVFGSVNSSDGYTVIGLQAVENGDLAELSEQERNSIQMQLAFQLGQREMASFEQAVVSEAEVDLNE